MGNLLDCSPGEEYDEEGNGGLEMQGDRFITVEEAKPLRDSLVWKLQRDFYSSVNVKAWSKAIVPNFVTSNSFIAKAYARVVFKFARDWFRNPNAARDQPIYVVEVGSGHGKLGFLLAKQLAQFAEFLPDMECSPPIKVVITDFEERDVEFWSQHEPLQHLIEAGWIDTAVFDAEGDTKMKLTHAGTELSAETLRNPPVVICNYVFDTLTQDAFRVKDGSIGQGMVTVKSAEPDADTREDGSFTHDLIRHMRCEWTFEDVDLSQPLYGDEDFDAILRSYTELEQGSVLMPIGGMRMVRNLAAFSNGRMLLLAGDKGYNTKQEMSSLRDPHVAVHGSFSFMVNFDAVRMLIERMGGFALQSPFQDGFKCCAFFLGGKSEDFKQTRWAFHEGMRNFSPETFSSLQRGIKEECPKPTLKHVLALLRLSNWDGDVFFKFKSTLIEKSIYPYASENVARDLRRDMAQVYESYYPLLATKDVCFELGRLCMGIKEYTSAVQFFELSNRLCGDHHVTWHNMGISYHYLGDLHAAIKCFSVSLHIKPQYEEARIWLEKLRLQLEATDDEAETYTSEEEEDGRPEGYASGEEPDEM